MPKQIYNKHILLSFASGTTPQQLSTTINVPFTVGKVIVHPLTRYIAGADVKTDNYILQCPNINPEGTGIIGTFAGDDTNSPNTQELKFIYMNGREFRGQHTFYLRSLTEAGGGASNPITTKILATVEFHEL